MLFLLAVVIILLYTLFFLILFEMENNFRNTRTFLRALKRKCAKLNINYNDVLKWLQNQN